MGEQLVFGDSSYRLETSIFKTRESNRSQSVDQLDDTGRQMLRPCDNGQQRRRDKMHQTSSQNRTSRSNDLCWEGKRCKFYSFYHVFFRWKNFHRIENVFLWLFFYRITSDANLSKLMMRFLFFFFFLSTGNGRCFRAFEGKWTQTRAQEKG